MSGAVYICGGGCDAECSHGESCVFGGLMARDTPHPVKRGRPAHYSHDGARHHEWVGAAGRCVVSADAEATS